MSSVTAKQSAPDLKSREFFLRHSRNPESFGLKVIRHNHFEIERPDGSFFPVRSMLSTHEIALLYACARFAWNGDAIVDLGPLMGASTWALSRGLTDAGVDAKAVIHAFDLWRSEASYRRYLDGYTMGGARSVLGEWIRATEGYHHLCEPHQGDFCSWQWDGRPIALLFVDIAKSWELNDHLVSTMFPCLRPGSLLIQQDYVHWNEYWVHMEMARFRPYFEHCQVMRAGSSFYRCIETPPADICATPVSSFSYEEQVQLLEDERRIAPPAIQEVMKVGAAKHAMDKGDFNRARALLDSTVLEPVTDNPLHEASGIAKSNHAAATARLEQLMTA